MSTQEQVINIINQWTMSVITSDDSDKVLPELGLDSIDQVEIVIMIEDEFNIVVDDEQAEKLNTITKLVNYIDLELDNKRRFS